MILRRLGNKKKLAKKIQAYFPPHKIYIEPFFGAGGMFFNKPKAKYNIVNDLDSDVFNLFQVVMDRKEELEKAFYLMPIHSDLLKYWKQNKEVDPIKKALRFLFLSNLTLLGNGATIQCTCSGNTKQQFYKKINHTHSLINDVKFFNIDFKKFLKNISFIKDGRNDEAKTFIYSDPPYLQTGNNYETGQKWTQKDVINLLDCLQKTKCKFAYSEFNNPFILNQAKERNLNINIIGERQNLKNRRVEILVTNYELRQKTLF